MFSSGMCRPPKNNNYSWFSTWFSKKDHFIIHVFQTWVLTYKNLYRLVKCIINRLYIQLLIANVAIVSYHRRRAAADCSAVALVRLHHYCVRSSGHYLSESKHGSRNNYLEVTVYINSVCSWVWQRRLYLLGMYWDRNKNLHYENTLLNSFLNESDTCDRNAYNNGEQRAVVISGWVKWDELYFMFGYNLKSAMCGTDIPTLEFVTIFKPNYEPIGF